MKKIVFLFLGIIFIISCQNSANKSPVYDIAGYDEEMIPITRMASDVPSPSKDLIMEKKEMSKKKIIKDGRIGIRVWEIEKSKNRIDTLISIHEGYYANESYNNSDYESSYVMTIRVPAQNYEALITDIESGDGEILYKEVDARDVTDQFIDLETRLENKRNYLKRYQELVNKAKTIKEILEIEEKIRLLEEEIESTTGRLKYLGDQVDYSTLNLTLTKRKEFKYNPLKRDKFSERLKQSVSKGWFGFLDFLLFMIKIWPFWLIVSLGYYLWRKYRKRKK